MKLSTFGKVAAGIVVATVIGAPLMAFAQSTLTDFSIDSFDKITRFGDKIGSWMLGILVVLAVIFVITAAFLYLTSAGDETKVGKAKSFILYAIVAVVVGVLAKTVIYMVKSITYKVGI